MLPNLKAGMICGWVSRRKRPSWDEVRAEKLQEVSMFLPNDQSMDDWFAAIRYWVRQYEESDRSFFARSKTVTIFTMSAAMEQ